MIFARENEFPEGEIGRITLFGAELYSGASAKMVEVETSEIGVGGEFAGVEIDAVGSLISVAFLGKSVDKGEVGLNIIGGFGEFGGRKEI